MENNTKQTEPGATQVPEGKMKQRYEAPKLTRLAMEETHGGGGTGGDFAFANS